MTTLTANETQVLKQLNTLKPDQFMSTKDLASELNLDTLFTSGIVCSMIRKEVIVSRKMKDHSEYALSDSGVQLAKDIFKPKSNKIVTVDGQKLTEKQVAVMKAVAYNEYCNKSPEEATSIDDLKTWCYVEDFATAADLPVTTTKGVLGTLVRRGLMTIEGWDEDNVVTFTEEGFKLLKSLI